jgi:tetratricopeptide (TPR) repeat protein
MNKKNQKVLSKIQIDYVLKLYSAGKIDEAINEIKVLNESFPNVPLLFNIMGACYNYKNDIDAAAKMFKNATEIKPDYAEAHFNLGVTMKILDDVSSAISSYKKAIEINPNYPDAHNNLGSCYKQIGKLKDAIESYEWAVAYKRDFYQAYNNLASVYSEIGKIDQALDNYESSLGINPKFIDAHFNLGILYKEIGRKQDSITSFKKVLEISPSNAEAHRNLSMIKTFKKNDSHIRKMISILNTENPSPSARISLNFALSKAFEDLKDYKKQFQFLENGSKLKKELLNYSIEIDKNRFSVLKKIFKRKPVILEDKNANLIKFKPIFIVGMPRSGTSLVEQIISSHRDVYGAGELSFLSKHASVIINNLLKDTKQTLIQKDLSTLNENYFMSLEDLKIKESVITDKMPDNFNYIGFILAAFPNAKIVHLRRNPIATCWSNYKFLFDTDGNGFTFDQVDLATYYRLYNDLMDHWHKLFPDKIYDICYEDLTINQEEETRKLIDYCDLEWDQNCLNFHKNKRAVKTVSALQVRKKIYQGSSEAWKNYEEYLVPLIEGLKDY